MDPHDVNFKLRATGRTTRIIDEIIQDLYLNYKKWITIYDHYYENDDQNTRNTKIIADKILKRMALEHPCDIVEKSYNCGRWQLKLTKCGPIDYKEEEFAKLEKENKTIKHEKVNIYR